jgi:hypothetical protein
MRAAYGAPTADYTLNERLAHYGPGVYGSHFRRVTLGENDRARRFRQ